jgi:hypothetical protein
LQRECEGAIADHGGGSVVAIVNANNHFADARFIVRFGKVLLLRLLECGSH